MTGSGAPNQNRGRGFLKPFSLPRGNKSGGAGRDALKSGDEIAHDVRLDPWGGGGCGVDEGVYPLGPIGVLGHGGGCPGKGGGVGLRKREGDDCRRRAGGEEEASGRWGWCRVSLFQSRPTSIPPPSGGGAAVDPLYLTSPPSGTAPPRQPMGPFRPTSHPSQRRRGGTASKLLRGRVCCGGDKMNPPLSRLSAGHAQVLRPGRGRGARGEGGTIVKGAVRGGGGEKQAGKAGGNGCGVKYPPSGFSYSNPPPRWA